jgi:hypothetical protein
MATVAVSVNYGHILLHSPSESCITLRESIANDDSKEERSKVIMKKNSTSLIHKSFEY